MIKTELIDASKIDYEAYSFFQRAAYKDLLSRSGSTDSCMTPQYYRWKYNTPDGEARIARVVEDGKILSSSAMIPLHIQVNESLILGWHCLDVATIPQARRKGFFLSTLKILKESVSKNEIFFAFPNTNSIPSFLKLGCCENVLLTTWVNPFSFISKRLSNKIQPIDAFGSKQDLYFNKLSFKNPALRRNSAYLNWRYVQHPNNKYAIFNYVNNNFCEGFVVARKAHVMGRDLVLIMELFGNTHFIESELLNYIVAWTIGSGNKMIVMMNSSLSFLHSIRFCFFPVPSFLLPKRQILILGVNNEKQEHIMKKKWDVQTGDWDVF